MLSCIGCSLVLISWRRAGHSLSSTLCLVVHGSHLSWHVAQPEPEPSQGTEQQVCLLWINRAFGTVCAATKFTAPKLWAVHFTSWLLLWLCHALSSQTGSGSQNWSPASSAGVFNSWETINWQLAAPEAASFGRFLLNTYINKYPWWVTSSPLLT